MARLAGVLSLELESLNFEHDDGADYHDDPSYHIADVFTASSANRRICELRGNMTRGPPSRSDMRGARRLRCRFADVATWSCV